MSWVDGADSVLYTVPMWRNIPDWRNDMKGPIHIVTNAQGPVQAFGDRREAVLFAQQFEPHLRVVSCALSADNTALRQAVAQVLDAFEDYTASGQRPKMWTPLHTAVEALQVAYAQ